MVLVLLSRIGRGEAVVLALTATMALANWFLLKRTAAASN
jgi:hypothetical protein